MAYYGRRQTADSEYGLTGGTSASNQRGQIYKAMTEHGWAYAIGMLGGKQSGQPNITWRGGIWAVSGSSLAERLAYSAAVTVSHVMTSGADGTLIEGTITTPIQLWSGVKYGIGWSAINGILVHGMKQASGSPPEPSDYYFHYRNQASDVPNDPFSAQSSVYAGAMANYVVYEPNVAPTTVTGTMVPSGFITSTTPVFEGDFVDANSDRGDLLNQYEIEVYRVSDNVKMWDATYNAGPVQQAANRFGKGYAGTTLVAGVAYQWRYRTSDKFGAWSAFSGYTTFTVNAGGTVSVASGTPTGKQETQTPTPFTGTWSHASALSTNAVEVRLMFGTGVMQVSGTIAKAVANGGAISVTWAETGFVPIEWGTATGYQIRARDSGAAWSPWSATRAFNINAAPTTPVIVTPSSGQVVSAYPLVTVSSTDADDTTGTGFGVNLRIKNAAGAVLFTRAMALVSGQWQYQTTGTDLASFAQYRLDAVATDGTVTTPYSSEVLFTYGQGPTITVTAPTAGATIVTNTPTITFSQNSTQVSYRVYIYEWIASALGPLIYDSGSVAHAAGSGVAVNHVMPSGYLRNGTSYRVIISSTNNLALTGTHAGVTFTLSFPAPDGPAAFEVSPILVGNDVQPSAVLLSWQEPSYASDRFLGAVVTRRPAGTSLLAATVLARLTSPSQTTFVDYYAPSGQSFVYAVIFEVMQGTDETESAAAEGSAIINLDHVVINSVTNGAVRAGLRYGVPMVLEHGQDILAVQPWGQASPHAFVGDYHAHSVKGTFSLQNDRYSQAADDRAGLVALHMMRGIVCYRDQYGTRIFGHMVLSERLAVPGAFSEVTLTVSESDFTEGVPA